ncbi:thioredoxin domain-containing protein [Synechococcus sp. PCC 7336]|uniref:DsbA family protein n=1 Tax=Synechococcus sp. PCC 7336 TaxID=195250 RepID=UPI000349C3C2|nr:thioredoxin domain-containing protein [Synechococcus sp. PCC 7336]
MVANLRRWCLLVAICSLCLAGCGPSPEQLQSQVIEIIRSNPQVIIESVQTYQAEQQAAATVAREEQQARALQPFANDPAGQIGTSPTRGAEDLAYVLYEFSDFQCPFCARSQATVEAFVNAHSKVALVFKHFPLQQIHPEALPAAQAAWAAHQQGKFWQYHDALFSHQDRLGEDYYLELASTLRLDLDRFNSDRPKANAAIRTDLEMAQQLGLQGTPFFTLNGIPLSGAVPLEQFEAALAAAIESAA